MKKLIVFFGIVAMLLGLRFFDNGVLSVNQSGKFTVYGENGAETVYCEEERPLLYRLNEYNRLDVSGDYETAMSGLKDLSAKLIRTENVEELIILYAYSPYINNYVSVFSEKVNVMIAIGSGKVVYGSPLIKGSF